MECPYCKSRNIIWDYTRGEIVCRSCGSVLDKIYSYAEYYDDEPVFIAKSSYIDFYKKVERTKKWVERIMGKRVVLYNGSYIREVSLNVAKLIESDEKYLIIYDVVNNIPQLRTKDIRYKLALALYLIDKEEFNKFKMHLGISEKYMEKLLSTLSRKEKERITNLLKERLADFLPSTP